MPRWQPRPPRGFRACHLRGPHLLLYIRIPWGIKGFNSNGIAILVQTASVNLVRCSSPNWGRVGAAQPLRRRPRRPRRGPRGGSSSNRTRPIASRRGEVRGVSIMLREHRIGNPSSGWLPKTAWLGAIKNELPAPPVYGRLRLQLKNRRWKPNRNLRGRFQEHPNTPTITGIPLLLIYFIFHSDYSFPIPKFLHNFQEMFASNPNSGILSGAFLNLKFWCCS